MANARKIRGTMGAAEDAVTAECHGDSSVAVVLTGTWSGTVTPEVTIDNVTWVATAFLNKNTDARAATVTANGSYLILHTEGCLGARVRMSAYTSGTATATVTAGEGGGSVALTVAPQGTSTVDTELPAAAALADNTATPTVPGVGAYGMVYDGTTWDFQRGTAADGTLVNTELPAAAALADGSANPTTPMIGAALMGWNGTTWDLVDTVNTGTVKVEQSYTHSTSAAIDTQIKASAGFLHTVTISCNDAAPTAGSLIVYDNTAESGTQVFNHTFTTTPFVPFSVHFDCVMTTGIYVGMTTTGDVNFQVTYR